MNYLNKSYDLLKSYVTKNEEASIKLIWRDEDHLSGGH